jgi:hypothetical protein
MTTPQTPSLAQDEWIDCRTHGRRPGTLMCRHLLEMTGIGFFTSDESDQADAWCAECEAAWQAEEKWTEAATAFAGFGLICDCCRAVVRVKTRLPDLDDDERPAKLWH